MPPGYVAVIDLFHHVLRTVPPRYSPVQYIHVTIPPSPDPDPKNQTHHHPTTEVTPTHDSTNFPLSYPLK